MKKTLIFLVLLIVAASVAACGGEEEGEPEGGATPAAGLVEISFWHSEVASNLDAIQGLARRFNSEQNEVRVKTAFQGNDTETMLKLTTFLGSADVPALIYLAEVDTQKLVDSGAARPVQDFIDREDYDLSDFDEKAIQYYTVDGQLYGMPFAIVVPLLYYNKLDFSEVGLDPEQPPRDLEEVRELSRKLVKRDSHGNILRAGIALDIEPWYFDVALAEHGDLYVNNGNGRHQCYHQPHAHGSLRRGLANSSTSSAREAFAMLQASVRACRTPHAILQIWGSNLSYTIHLSLATEVVVVIHAGLHYAVGSSENFTCGKTGAWRPR